MSIRLCRRIAALALFGLLLPAVSSAAAFDEDHTEVINGTTLHFRVRGADKANPYLVLLHGGPGFSSHMFYAWGPSLEKSLNVVYLDQRGSGQSERLKVANVMDPQPAEVKDYTIANLVQDIEGVRQSLKVDKWYVLGHSWGGMLGLEYVTAHPDHVLGYVHVDGLVSVPQMQNAILDDAQKKFEAATPKNEAGLAQVAQIRVLPPDNPMRLLSAFGLAMGPAGLYFAGDQATAFPAFLAGIRTATAPYHLPPTALIPANEPAVALMINDHYLIRDDTPLLAKVTVPTLIINGKQDGVIPPASAEAVHAAIRGSRLVELDDCGHFPFIEQPARTTGLILAMMDGFLGFPSDGHNRAAMVIGSFNDIKLPNIDPWKLTRRDIQTKWKVDEQGHPSEIQITPSGDDRLDAAIVDAIRHFRFVPGTRDGKPFPTTLTHRFVIDP